MIISSSANWKLLFLLDTRQLTECSGDSEAITPSFDMVPERNAPKTEFPTIGLEWSVGLLLVYFFLILQFMYIKRMKKIRLNEKQLDVHEIILYYFCLLDIKAFKKIYNIKYG